MERADLGFFAEVFLSAVADVWPTGGRRRLASTLRFRADPVVAETSDALLRHDRRWRVVCLRRDPGRQPVRLDHAGRAGREA